MANQIPYDASMTPIDLARNISEVQLRIQSAAAAAGRLQSAVTLLAVSKTKPSEAVRLAYEQGLTEFGENYAQEMAEKAHALRDLPICWHFIGPIQSNKTKLIAEISDWVHSVDRIKIARRLGEQRPPARGPLNILVQVNISGERSKSGVAPEVLPEFVHDIKEMPGLSLRGLMAIPAPPLRSTDPRLPFKRLRTLLESLSETAPGIDTLSMGMSADLEDAIAEGATHVRVGTDIFGARYN
jgi:pyridoxal phosphate enzyme (YggS family)